ncbi:cell cycle switch protein CCS52A (macronuclear) [Tetrahymena thermophila SB210]|uniref:Cell cycle switch protein CCS52A n=1 Tax=Tetrahymena thermophila (strain SB210) TaxID=312017 RepID=Q22CY9_TETTS|nr:cell cycle switch protein CCS52A [Tetrahymena thermophila SB210]EAR83130.2 cell cycle switch protein CCS52A [Tetrahymena thermophila SB210]|eukprot:XP_001030793.2 cell cycle switch protein CCS52A [Tetrahymena thermophila SB210]
MSWDQQEFDKKDQQKLIIIIKKQATIFKQKNKEKNYQVIISVEQRYINQQVIASKELLKIKYSFALAQMLNNQVLESIRHYYQKNGGRQESKNTYKFDGCNNQRGGQPAKVMINDASSTTTDDSNSLQSLDQQPINECFFDEALSSQNTVFISSKGGPDTPTFQPTSRVISSSIPFCKSISSFSGPIQITSSQAQQSLLEIQQQQQQQVCSSNSIAGLSSSKPIIHKNIFKIQKSKAQYEDRFIPSRKHSKLSIALTMAHDENIVPQLQLMNSQDSSNQQNGNSSNNGLNYQVIQAVNQKDLCSQQVSIADLYKTQVLGIKPPETKFSKYEGKFQNRNILAFCSPKKAKQFSKAKLGPKDNELLSQNDLNGDINFLDRVTNNLFGSQFSDNLEQNQYTVIVDPISNMSNQNYYSRQILSHIDPLNNFHSTHPFNLNPDIKTYFTRNTRKISKIPFKVLDAPTLKDDFYLNLIDWGENNQIAVGLGSCVYLWSASTSRVTKLCDLRNTININGQSTDESDNITSVSWSSQGTYLSIGTNSGSVSVWDIVALKKVKEYNQHRQRVGALSWNKNLLVSGSRDKKILIRDVRLYQPVVHKLLGHKQEICGLKWSYDHQMLASGGNDNNLFVWNMHSSSPIIKLQSHTAAVKALSWSPHQHGLLISGGGSLDRTIRIWNTITREQIKCIDTGSQVCNLQFCKNRNEFVSTHGYSENQIIIWNYPDLDKLAVLTGHTQRVLHLAMSPDGDTIASGAGDETLRFWNINDSQSKEHEIQNSINKSQLLPQKNYLR